MAGCVAGVAGDAAIAAEQRSSGGRAERRGRGRETGRGVECRRLAGRTGSRRDCSARFPSSAEQPLAQVQDHCRFRLGCPHHQPQRLQGRKRAGRMAAVQWRRRLAFYSPVALPLAAGVKALAVHTSLLALALASPRLASPSQQTIGELAMDLAMAVADRLPLSLISSHSPRAQLGWQQGMLAGNRRSRHLGETAPRGGLG